MPVALGGVKPRGGCSSKSGARPMAAGGPPPRLGGVQASSRPRRVPPGQAPHAAKRTEASDAAAPAQASDSQDICLSEAIPLHAIVIGLFVNHYEFSVPI
jgi:hypothetical protein